MVGIRMKMPEKCSDCRFCHYKNGSKYVCYAAKLPFSFGLRAWGEGRPKRCPLVVVVEEEKQNG